MKGNVFRIEFLVWDSKTSFDRAGKDCRPQMQTSLYDRVIKNTSLKLCVYYIAKHGAEVLHVNFSELYIAIT